MSDEIILNLSFDNQTVTDLTGNWTLDGTPNATYEQIEGRDGYSIVEGSLGRCIVLNAVDQNARYDEYTVDFDMFVKSTYTSNYYTYNVFYLWSQKNPKIVGSFYGKIGEVLSISPKIGVSSPVGVTRYSPIGRWVHVTITSGPTGEADLYHTAVYVDGVKLIERTDSGAAYDGNPFGISQRIIPCARDPGSFLMPNGPGVCLNTYKIVAGIHAPDQKPAISLPNLSRVFQNFCTWLKGQLSTVALTGSYNDLSDKPTISTVNDGTLTIQKNGTNVATFTANQSTAATANITVPTAVSELTNDSGYLTSSSNLDASKLTSGTVDIERLPQGALERLIKVANEAARYALTTADVQLGDTVQQLDTGIMYIVTDADHLDSAAGYTEYTAGTAASVPWSGVTGKPTFAAVATSGAYSDLTGTPALAAVATSGAYSDLTGTPTIPTVNNATLTIQQNGTNVQTFTANASTNATANIQCVDLTNNQTVAGNKEFTGTTTAHDVVPSATDTYNFGSSTAQWNNAYIKSLTINGVACGDILTHNASEFVGVSGNQTIVGVKSFKDTIIRNVGNFTVGEAPTTQTSCAVLRHTNNDSTHSANSILSYMFNTGETMCELTQIPCIGSVARTWFRTNTDGSYSIYSYTKNGFLGVSGYRWKDVQTEKINNLNPGALSLPSTYVNVDTTNWVLDGSNVNIFTPASDGWLGIQVTDTVYDQMHYVFVGRNDSVSYHSQNVLSPINALWDSKYHGCVFIPVIKNINYDIRCICSNITATFYPCQGNV